MEATTILLSGFLIILLAVLWLLLRRGKLRIQLAQPRERFPLEVLARLHLSSHHSVQVVRVRHRVLVLGVSATAMAVLDSFPAEETARSLPAVDGARRAG